MGDDLPAPAALLGDNGYDADRIRDWAEARDAVPVIPMRRCRKARKSVDRALYALHNRIERTIGRLKHSRRPATRLTTKPPPASSASSISPASDCGSALSSTRPRHAADGDGSVSLVELAPAYFGRMRPRMVDAFRGLDEDGDAAITDGELDARFGAVVERLDRDGDDALSLQHGRRGRR